jgi:tetratricopeptide (TPR) repeat protein
MKKMRVSQAVKSLLLTLAGTWIIGCAGSPPDTDLMSLDEAVAAVAAAVEAAVPPGVEIVIVRLEAPLPSIAELLSDRLNARFVANRNLKVLVRGDALNSISTEHEFQMSGLVSDKSAVGIGHYAGAKVVITGTFERFGNFSQLWVRAVDVETSQLLAMHPALIRNNDPLLAEITQPIGNQNTPVVTKNALEHLNNGNAAYAQKDYDRAIADYTAALRINPDYATAYYNRGLAYANKKDYDRAIADYTAALRINPDYASTYYGRGLAYSHKGDYDRAVADYTAALRISPDYAAAYNNRGIAYANKKDYDRAIADYTAALRINPNNADTYLGRGHAYHTKGDYDRAVADCSAALSINPDYALAYNNRGIAYYTKGDYDRAVADFTAALRINPNDAAAKDGLERARKSRGY